MPREAAMHAGAAARGRPGPTVFIRIAAPEGPGRLGAVPDRSVIAARAVRGPKAKGRPDRSGRPFQGANFERVRGFAAGWDWFRPPAPAGAWGWIPPGGSHAAASDPTVTRRADEAAD